MQDARLPPLISTRQDAAQESKTKNIIDMGLTFSAMMRLFSKGAKPKLTARLERLFAELESISEKEDYERVHADFCSWCTHNILSAEKKLKNGRIKLSIACSYGQAAKLLDIAAKVYVYYCAQPSAETARRLIPMLHGAVDNPIMQHLTDRFPEARIRSKTIEQIDRDDYERLQALVARAIAQDYGSEIHPVQYDDILWRQFSRSAQVP